MMFFYISKIFWFAAQPLDLAILLLLAAVFAGLFGRRRVSVRLSACAFLVLALSSWTSLGAWMISPLEERYARPPLPDRVDGIIVLGGGFESAVNLVRGGYELNDSGDRFVEAAILARRYPTVRIVVSGGDPALTIDEEPDATTAPRLLTALGVAPERLVLEGKSRNTYENAVFTKAMVSPRPAETWLLVTSAFHMPRAKALFDKVGFPVIPWPVDYRTTGQEGLGLFARNPIDALQTTTLAAHEWIGLFAYWLTGRIDAPFPAANR
jgi:uncharacterized SAM-binding protein YcdF (DUF218 family)